MNKVIFLLVAILLNSVGFSQNQNGEVIYKVIFSEDSTLQKKSDRLFQMQQQAARGSSKIKLILKFNKKFSEFSLLKSIEDSDTKFAIAWANCRNTIYNDLNAKKSYYNSETSSMGLVKKDEFLIFDNLGDNWIISTETKTIDEFECYKATKSIEYSTSKGVQRKDIIAWYCPKIPFSFGPKGYYGLPGLILELTDKNITYVAEKILLRDEIIKIEIPTNGKLVSNEEYQNILKNRFEEAKKNIEK